MGSESNKTQLASAYWENHAVSLVADSVGTANSNISALCSVQVVLKQKNAFMYNCFITIINAIMLL